MRHSFIDARVGWWLVLFGLIGSLGWGCRRVDPRTSQAPGDARFAAPTLARLVSSATSPFHHSPVAWRYQSARFVDDEPDGTLIVALTTTRERHVVAGVGLLLKVVVELRESEVDSDFRSYVMLLTPSGLYMSEPNSFDGALAESAAALVEALTALGPSWPLPGQAGCTSRVRDVALPFGAVRGLETTCEDLLTPLGHVDATTLWVDQVGFVYRETVTHQEGGPRIVRRDVLAAGDLVELAPSALSDEPASPF